MKQNLTIRGRSLGGIYTSVYIPEFSVQFDVGVALRDHIGARFLCLSHGHVDHVGALPAFVGMRGLFGQDKPLTVFCPAPIEQALLEGLLGFQKMQGYDLNVEIRGLQPGDEVSIGKRLSLKAFKTYHPTPSLGYCIFESVNKLRPEFHHLDPHQLRERRRSDPSIFELERRNYFAYATDTLPDVLRHEPWLKSVRELMLECTFLDERKTVANARRGGHIHLDELRKLLPTFENEKLHLMHFSQLYSPGQVREVFQAPWTEALIPKICPLLPENDRDWWH